MKKFLALVLILGMAQVASAGFLISVDGVVDPPDTSIELLPSEYAMIDIHTDGTESQQAVWLVCEGPGVFQSAGVLNPAVGWAAVATSTLYTTGDGSGIVEWFAMDPPDGMGYTNTSSVVNPEFFLAAAGLLPAGMLIDEIAFHCEGPGEVLLTLLNENFELMDTQLIHQIPEPMTMALLGLGGLALIRRRK